jgi:uncharacterized membrane protein YraQ (UPF0718 family)
MNPLLHGLYAAAAMLWETLWALVLGFSLSAVLQVFVRHEQMVRHFGRANLRSMALAAFLGAASSSCSYAAASAAKTAFKKGSALAVALAFMFASTNLVVELSAVLWLLMGWVFVLAEFVGAFVLIGVMWALLFNALGLVPQGVRPPSAIQDARFQWSYTTWLKLAALCLVAWFLRLRLRQKPAIGPHGVMPHGA